MKVSFPMVTLCFRHWKMCPTQMERNPKHHPRYPGARKPLAGPLQSPGLEPADASDDKQPQIPTLVCPETGRGTGV
jgi:hypothetical protein